ncbi:MAG: MerR family transcriptional regulator [Treponema sp.]|nr:MerR family transcriptional regulator [Treponema sp.]
MVSYAIGEIKRLLQIETHVVRYWEKEVPLIQPQKDKRGRKLYSSHDLQILLRLKYLLYERRFTIEGARGQLFRELAGDYQNRRAQVTVLRSELLDLYFFVHKV